MDAEKSAPKNERQISDTVHNVPEEQLVTMRQRRALGTWHAYQNHALDSANAGCFVFLVVGPSATFKTAPEHAPDGPHGLGWKYVHVGTVDLDKGCIVYDTEDTHG